MQKISAEGRKVLQ